jgi:hypothetical protein
MYHTLYELWHWQSHKQNTTGHPVNTSEEHRPYSTWQLQWQRHKQDTVSVLQETESLGWFHGGWFGRSRQTWFRCDNLVVVTQDTLRLRCGGKHLWHKRHRWLRLRCMALRDERGWLVAQASSYLKFYLLLRSSLGCSTKMVSRISWTPESIASFHQLCT